MLYSVELRSRDYKRGIIYRLDFGVLLRTAKSGNVMVMWSEASHRHGYRLDFGVQNYCFFLYPANIFRYFFHFARFFLLFSTFQRRQNVYSEERIRTFGTTHTDVRKNANELSTAIIRTFDSKQKVPKCYVLYHKS